MIKNLVELILRGIKIGTLIADRAIKKGVKSVVFDRGGYKYHGRVKALAEAQDQLV